MRQGEVPGHVAAGELAGDEDPVAVDGVPLAGVAEGKLDGGVLAGRVAIVGRLAGQAVLGRDHDVAPPGRLGRPDLDGRLRSLAGMEDDDRGIGAERVILRRQAHGVLGGHLVLVLGELVDDGLLEPRRPDRAAAGA